MCGLFGFTIYNKDIKNYDKLLNALGDNASIRGTHATGISYNLQRQSIIYKKPLPAYKMTLKHYNGVKAITGHTRHATQGKAEKNYNNHPFKGKAGNVSFTVAHNGIIYNDTALRKNNGIEKTIIDTDSYIYCQLIENAGKLNFETLARCTEELQGYYTFSILDENNNLYFVRGDSPLAIVHLKRLKMYVYASTEEILYKAIIDAGMINEIITGEFEAITTTDGEIIKIDNNGKITRSTYTPATALYTYKNWYEYGDIYDDTGDYMDELISVAKYMGYDDKEIKALYDEGYSLEDIEEFIYSGGVECF